ncbi:CRISPR-associated protein Cas5 [Terrisporobacter sp.]|uniref:CRISPR-associated protein Cas5 n=1 Tax=Terrisporobacter sp. TaxID=1965305 RepID=UPI00262184B3|nr:CRISPR-associated protein Cas5 [Terrisporobacter sp.]
MKALRIELHQSSANYKKEETIDNKMTYPLPPISTIIGALHNACGYKEYKEMDISVQGNFESMHKEPYTDYCFLNSTMDDRGTLVKMRNEDFLSKAFDKVAKANKSQGSSFRKGITIQVYNQELLDEYNKLKDLNDEIKKFKDTKIKKVLELTKKRKKSLSEKKKKFDKKSDEYKTVAQREKEIKNYEKLIKEKVKEYEIENYTKPISKYRSLTTSVKYYEILNNIDLVIHVRSDEKTLNELLENIYNLKSIGRSEDFVEVKDAKIVELYEGKINFKGRNSIYLNYDDVKSKKIRTKSDEGKSVNGTVYYLNKNYKIEDGKRVFVKKKVLYTSLSVIRKTSDNVFVDKEGKKEYIVSFI